MPPRCIPTQVVQQFGRIQASGKLIHAGNVVGNGMKDGIKCLCGLGHPAHVAVGDYIYKKRFITPLEKDGPDMCTLDAEMVGLTSALLLGMGQFAWEHGGETVTRSVTADLDTYKQGQMREQCEYWNGSRLIVVKRDMGEGDDTVRCFVITDLLATDLQIRDLRYVHEALGFPPHPEPICWLMADDVFEKLDLTETHQTGVVKQTAPFRGFLAGVDDCKAAELGTGEFGEPVCPYCRKPFAVDEELVTAQFTSGSQSVRVHAMCITDSLCLTGVKIE